MLEFKTTHTIPLDRQAVIIINELEMWRDSRYLLQLRHRVNTGLGASPGVMKPIEDELVRCEKAIDILKVELDALTPAPNGKVE